MEGTAAKLSEILRERGYRYVGSHPRNKYGGIEREIGAVSFYEKDPEHGAYIELAAFGRPARRVNIPISPTMTKTREHQTPDVYHLYHVEGKEAMQQMRRRTGAGVLE